jgi:predicted metal-dependent peptidase
MAARVQAQYRWPYISHLLFSMRQVEVTDGSLQTMAVDSSWRLYFNPEFVLSQDVQSLATVLQHEAMHCMLTHADRFEELRDATPNRKVFNIAADCGINHVIEEAGFSFSDHFQPVRFADFDSIDEKMSTEQAYYILMEQSSGTKPSEDDENPGKAEDPSENKPKDHGQKEEAGSSQDDHDCGSVSGGLPREYELAIEDERAPGSSKETQAVVISRVASDVTQAAKGRGSVPGGLQRWADEWLSPQVNWRRQLAVRVRTSLATKSGRRDYSMMRPSRREQGLTLGDVQIRLPSMRQPASPKTKVILDTSGSIGTEELKAALAEVMGILKAVGNSDGLYVIPCDSKAYPAQLVRTPTDMKNLKLPGGGGTDMGMGLAAAVLDKPKPDVIIVITDGFTPWPDEKPKGCDNFIVVVTEQQGMNGVPIWAKSILAEGLN